MKVTDIESVTFIIFYFLLLFFIFVLRQPILEKRFKYSFLDGHSSNEILPLMLQQPFLPLYPAAIAT